MKTLLQRFTRWFNRTHNRSGTLWEERYKSVIEESGIAARTMAAYIDLNPGSNRETWRADGPGFPHREAMAPCHLRRLGERPAQSEILAGETHHQRKEVKKQSIRQLVAKHDRDSTCAHFHPRPGDADRCVQTRVSLLPGFRRDATGPAAPWC
jgi:hypothetical protein